MSSAATGAAAPTSPPLARLKVRVAGTSRLAVDIAYALQHRFRDVAAVEILHGGLKTGVSIAVDYRGHQREFTCTPRGQSLTQLVDALTHDIVGWMATVVKDDAPVEHGDR